MHILVAALGSPGHAFPLVPLARALHDEGHDVTFATGPDLVPTIATSGVPTTAVGRPVFDVFREVMVERGMTARPDDPETMRSVAYEVFGSRQPRAFASELVPRLDDRAGASGATGGGAGASGATGGGAGASGATGGDAGASGATGGGAVDLVVAEVGCPGAALAARATGTPCVLHSFGRRPSPVAPMSVTVDEPLAAVAADLGIALGAGEALGHAYLDVCPPSLQDPGSEAYLAGLAELPLRPVGWNPPTPFTSRLRGDRPWVLLTLGTAFGDAEVLRAAVAGLADTGADVLVATGSVDAGGLADLRSATVQVEPFVPQADLLAGRVAGAEPPAVVVHHGGSGTTLACSAAGVPQLFLPQGADQFFNAAAVVGVGAGRQLLPGEATPALVGTAVRDLLDEAPERASARALAAEVAALPSPATVAAEVARWGQPLM